MKEEMADIRKLKKGIQVVNKKETSNYKFNDQFILSIRGTYNTLKFLGLWPQTESPNLYNFLWLIYSVGFSFQLFGPLAGMFVKRSNARELIDNLGFVIPIVVFFAKWLTFSSQKNTLKTIFIFVDKDWANLNKDTSISQSVSDSKRIMAECSRIAKIFFITYISVLALSMSNYVRDSVKARNSRNNETDFDRILPIPYSWYPLDLNRSLNIQFLATTQVITLTISSLTNAAIDSCFITVTLHLCGQFEILCRFIEGITYSSLSPRRCEAKITLMVKRHQDLLSVGKRLQDAYSILILTQLVGCTLVICFLGYTLLAELESNSTSTIVLLKTGFMWVSALQIIFAYCLAGDYLTSQSLAVAKAAYNAEWYDCTRSINLSFSILMIRAQRPIEITGAKLFSMSLENFTVLLKSAASYLSVLRAIGIGEG